MPFSMACGRFAEDSRTNSIPPNMLSVCTGDACVAHRVIEPIVSP